MLAKKLYDFCLFSLVCWFACFCLLGWLDNSATEVIPNHRSLRYGRRINGRCEKKTAGFASDILGIAISITSCLWFSMGFRLFSMSFGDFL